MKKPAKPKRGRRWPDSHEKAARVLVTLPPALDAAAIEIGDGNRSQGIQIAIQEAVDRRKKSV